MIYITGATGRLGKQVMKLIPNAIPLVREKSKLKKEVITDFSEKELKIILKNAKTIIHLAGSMDFTNTKKLWAVNVDLTKNIIDSMPKNAKIIFASSISVYGKKMKQNPASEKTPLNADTRYAKSKKLAEDIVKKHKNHVILRIGTIYGKEFEEYQTILKMIKKRKMFILGDGKNSLSFVHVRDVAKAIKNSIKKAIGIYILAGDPETQENILKIAAKAMDVQMPTKKVPVQLALMYAKAQEMKANFQNKNPKIGTEHVLILSSDRKYNCKKAKKELKFRPRKIKKGILEIANSIRKS